MGGIVQQGVDGHIWAKLEDNNGEGERDKPYAVDVLDQVIAELVVDLGGLFTVRSLLNIVLLDENNDKGIN